MSHSVGQSTFHKRVLCVFFLYGFSLGHRAWESDWLFYKMKVVFGAVCNHFERRINPSTPLPVLNFLANGGGGGWGIWHLFASGGILQVWDVVLYSECVFMQFLFSEQVYPMSLSAVLACNLSSQSTNIVLVNLTLRNCSLMKSTTNIQYIFNKL